MDAATFRWVLIVIAVIVVLAVYFVGQHQARLRKRSAMENFTRHEVDSTFIEDEELHLELDNLNRILRDNEAEAEVDEIHINPADDSARDSSALPHAEIFVPAMLAGRDESRLVSYHLRHGDFRLITGEEASAAAEQASLRLNGAGYLEYRDNGEVAFRVASLSAPGTFNGFDQLEFTTLGLNCYVDLDACREPGLAYEAMLKKIDELVRMLNVKVYKPNQELLTISDVTAVREQFC
jgi:FtsZ-interacting cell division protein ZipA